jgi:hypothetical protein
MKAIKSPGLIALALFSGNVVHAACEAPVANASRYCIGCGNLQANPVRGVDLVWNWLAADREFASRLRYSGNATIVLDNPPNASPGVTFFWGGITDEGFTVVDTTSYAELMRLRAGVGKNIWGVDLEMTMSELEQTAIHRNPNAPYRISLFDQNGNLFHQESLGKVTPPVLDRANYSIVENARQEQYRQAECAEMNTEEADDASEDDEVNWEELDAWWDEDWEDQYGGDCSACVLEDWNEDTGEWEPADWQNPKEEEEEL